MFVPVDLDSSNLSDVAAQDDFFSAGSSNKLELHASLFEDEITNAAVKDEQDLFIPKDAEIDTKGNFQLDDSENTDDLLT